MKSIPHHIFTSNGTYDQEVQGVADAAGLGGLEGSCELCWVFLSGLDDGSSDTSGTLARKEEHISDLRRKTIIESDVKTYAFFIIYLFLS